MKVNLATVIAAMAPLFVSATLILLPSVDVESPHLLLWIAWAIAAFAVWFAPVKVGARNASA